jgi:hypothetical protein
MCGCHGTIRFTCYGSSPFSPNASRWLWPKGRVSRQGQPGRRSGQGLRASMRAGSPAGLGVEQPAPASGRCRVLTRRGPVIRNAQWQDSDSFSRAAASGDPWVAGAAGTDAGSAPRPPLAEHPEQSQDPDQLPRAAGPSNRREVDVAGLRAETGTSKVPYL